MAEKDNKNKTIDNTPTEELLKDVERGVVIDVEAEEKPQMRTEKIEGIIFKEDENIKATNKKKSN